MYIKDLFLQKKPVISLEVFPPKTECGVETIYQAIGQLKGLKPDFISVTYSAGGVGSDKTVEIASAIKNNFGIEAMAHLTCITSSREKIGSLIAELQKHNIQNILALRGDIPAGFERTAKLDYEYASDLIQELKTHNGFCIGAAAYPEGHIDCGSLLSDLANLEKKINAGADFLITQLFFDNKLFYEFLDLKAKFSIHVPVSVGVMPILNKQQVQKMIFMCGASLPSQIIRMLNKYENHPESLREAGIQYAARQIEDLISNGVDGIHIYTMNQPDIAEKILGHIQSSLSNKACG